jgi:hypothetical protein
MTIDKLCQQHVYICNKWASGPIRHENSLCQTGVPLPIHVAPVSPVEERVLKGPELCQMNFSTIIILLSALKQRFLTFGLCRTRKENNSWVPSRSVQHISLYRAELWNTAKCSFWAAKLQTPHPVRLVLFAEFQYNIRLQRTIVHCTCRRDSVELVEPWLLLTMIIRAIISQEDRHQFVWSRINHPRLHDEGEERDWDFRTWLRRSE